MSPISVLMVTNESAVGGGQAQALALATYLPPRWKAQLAGGGGGPLVTAAEVAGIPFHPLPFGGAGAVRVIPALRQLVKNQRTQIVHTHGGVAGLWGRLACAGLGVKVVHTFHGIHYLHYPEHFWRAAYTLVDRALAPLADRMICVCAADAAAAVAAGVARESQMRIVPNGIPLPDLPPAGARETARSRLGLGATTPVIGCVARFHRQKGLPHLLTAIATLAPEFPVLRLVLVGGGAEEPALRAQVGRLKIEQQVVFAGAVNAEPLYAGFDVFCLPSLWEGLPLVLLEAMARGLPAVATAVDGIPEVVRDEVDGLLVPQASPEALAGALRRLLTDPTLAARLAAAGRARVMSNFTQERCVEQTAAVYAELLNA